MGTKTLEQEKYVSGLLKKKAMPRQSRKYRKEKPFVSESEIKKTDYMRNCIFHIEEFIAGRRSVDQLSYSLDALQKHLNDLRIQYLISPPNGNNSCTNKC